MPEVEFESARILKALSHLPPDEAEQVIRRITDTLSRLNWRTPGIKKLSTGAYRLRIGTFRVAFVREGDTIVVTQIKPRSKAYRKG